MKVGQCVCGWCECCKMAEYDANKLKILRSYMHDYYIHWYYLDGEIPGYPLLQALQLLGCGPYGGDLPSLPPASMDWHPICTVPHNGDLVLVWMPSHCQGVGACDLAAWTCGRLTLKNTIPADGATHWCPLPGMPEGSGNEV